jgi:hypothetical protein
MPAKIVRTVFCHTNAVIAGVWITPHLNVHMEYFLQNVQTVEAQSIIHPVVRMVFFLLNVQIAAVGNTLHHNVLTEY